MPKLRGNRVERMGTEGASSLSAAQLQATIRRLGWVAARVHEVVMSRLIADGDVNRAERFNDMFKPLVDVMLHWSDEQETNDGDA